MNKILIIFLLFISITSCASTPKNSNNDKIENAEELLDQAEANASIGGRRILEASRGMIADQEIVIGGCWNYINAVYDRAGYPTKDRSTFYKSKFKGPYVKSEEIRPGDWLYFVNHSYSDTEHSAIFVTWMDEGKKDALMVSYVGGNQKKPATYKRFNLNNIYNIIRVQD